MDILNTRQPEVKENAMDDTKAEEMVSFLFTTDSLIESEYLQTLRRTQHLEPEKSLMLGVLRDAIDCFLDNVIARNGKRKRHFREAEKWIFEEETAWAFSFESICEILGLDPAYIRKGLRQRERDKFVRIVSPGEPVPLSTRGTAQHKRSGTISKQVQCDPLVHEEQSVQLRKAVGSF
jgi:hypothetical protein